MDTSHIFHPNQQRAYDKIIANRGGVVWMRVGTGKTRVALVAAWEMAQDSEAKGIIVVCRRIAFDDWRNEIATLQIPLETIECEKVRADTRFTKPTLVLMSEGMLGKSHKDFTLEHLDDNYQIGIVVVDEGYLFKNPASNRHKAIIKFTRKYPTILLSGSIMSRRDLVEIYGQITAAGRGYTLAKHLTAFREEFQMGINPGIGNFNSYFPKPGAYQKIMERVESYTHVFIPKKSEREIKESVIVVPPTDEQKEYFWQLKHLAAIEGKIELKNMANVVTKAQEISDGWLRTSNGVIEYIESSKVERCAALVEEIIDDGKRVIIWCAFREDIARLQNTLQEIASVATLQGGQNFDAAGWTSGIHRICIATEASGSSVNFFAQVPYAIFFSQNWKLLDLQQAKGRTDRQSSQHPVCFYTYLHTRLSLDAQVYHVVNSSDSEEKAFIDRMEVNQWIKG